MYEETCTNIATKRSKTFANDEIDDGLRANTGRPAETFGVEDLHWLEPDHGACTLGATALCSMKAAFVFNIQRCKSTMDKNASPLKV